MSTSIKEIATSLAAFQGEVGKVKKDSTNPFFKSKYASLANILDVIRGPLAKNGLSFTQFPHGENELTTVLMHTSGEFIQGTYKMIPVSAKPQDLGSAITYQRRYALGAILGLNIDDDDDGNAANGNGKTEAKKQENKPAQSAPTQTATNIDRLEQSYKEVEDAKTINDVLAVWNKYPDLHECDPFILKCTNRKGQLSMNSKK
ncbi:MAG: ERF family protein [Cytophagaceae bacterium]|jgi:hypothetical protein|nr:ERF family protein [Cytophagaceae bacterium]